MDLLDSCALHVCTLAYGLLPVFSTGALLPRLYSFAYAHAPASQSSWCSKDAASALDLQCVGPRTSIRSCVTYWRPNGLESPPVPNNNPINHPDRWNSISQSVSLDTYTSKHAQTVEQAGSSVHHCPLRSVGVAISSPHPLHLWYWRVLMNNELRGGKSDY